MVQMTRLSAQNSQYSSTGVGFQIRNDLYDHISAGYPIFPSQAPASGRTYTCMCAQSSAIFRRISIHVRRHIVTNTQAITGQYMPTSFLTHHQRIHITNFTSHSSLINCITYTLQNLPLNQADPNSLPKKCLDNTCRSLEVHLQVTCDINMLSTYSRRVQSGHNRGSLAARPEHSLNNVEFLT